MEILFKEHRKKCPCYYTFPKKGCTAQDADFDTVGISGKCCLEDCPFMFWLSLISKHKGLKKREVLFRKFKNET